MLLPLASTLGRRAVVAHAFEELITRTMASETPEGWASAKFVERALGDFDLDK
jgi:hypothetical protein